LALVDDRIRPGTLNAEWLAGRELIVASHRGPVEHQIGPDGDLIPHRGSGGLMTALATLGEGLPFTWVSAAMGEGDRRAAISGKRTTVSEAGGEVRYVTVSERVYHAHYNLFSNPFLWFVQHGLAGRLAQGHGSTELWDAWISGYRPMNIAFADTVHRAARTDDPVVLVQDYQLYTAPRSIRTRLPEASILHFCHIPWPDPDNWKALPSAMMRELLRGMLGADILGFQDQRSSLHFLRTCRAYLPDASVDMLDGWVRTDDGETQVRVYPISVDPDILQSAVHTPATRSYQEALAADDLFTFVRVDRVDPSKNVPIGFRAFRRLLQQQPELVGKVRFLAFLVPSRTSIPEYQREHDEVMAAIQDVNQRFGRPGYQPIEYFYENNWHQALAGMSIADAVLVNSVADGMNLVAKETPIVSQRDACLMLSREIGAWSELGGPAIGVDPLSVESTASALAAAIKMSPVERAMRAAELRRRVERYDIWKWLGAQCEDLAALAERPYAPSLEALSTA
jgi:trehalose 6-phosphate synthase